MGERKGLGFFRFPSEQNETAASQPLDIHCTDVAALEVASRYASICFQESKRSSCS